MKRHSLAFTILVGAASIVLGAFVFGHKLDADAGSAIVDHPSIVNTSAHGPEEDALLRGLDYLASSQQPDGGFGAGSHGAQEVRDAHAVQTDPATTAFAAMAFVRAGSTLHGGPYRTHLHRALEYLLHAVEASSEEEPSITNLQGTQPQSKLGQDVDVAFTAQLLGRVLPMTKGALHERTREALDKCARKLAFTQGSDGSWNGRGSWAGTLQSAMAVSALEAAQAAGIEGYDDALRRGRARQQEDLDPETAEVRTESSAGVALYAITSAQRAAAPQARDARVAVEQAKKAGRLGADIAVSADALKSIGYRAEEAEQLASAFERNRTATEMLQSDQVLDGFGSNGGEEFLSYMMTSESLFLTDREAYGAWYRKMSDRLTAIQNANGSWSGHHCITSPVFCTAAVILTLTTGEDEILLSQLEQ